MKFSIIAGIALSGLLSFFGQAAEEQKVGDMPRHEVPASAAPLESGRAARNIILMVGDGMGPEHVWAAWACNGGRLHLMRLPVVGYVQTSSASHAVTDSAAAGTAIACGARTANGTVGQSPEGKPYVSFAAEQRARGVETGLVVTKDITDATPAAFYAHAAARRDKKRISSQLPQAGFSVVMGGGAATVPQKSVEEMRGQGALVELSAPGDLKPASRRGNYLPQAVARALDELEDADKGFFLMVEGSQIDSASHANDLRELVAEVLDFDRAIGVVLRWMESHPDTLLVVTADHQTGGLSLLDANVAEGWVVGNFSTTNHSGWAVPLYAAGAGAERFGGIYENRRILERLRAARDAAPVAQPKGKGR